MNGPEFLLLYGGLLLLGLLGMLLWRAVVRRRAVEAVLMPLRPSDVGYLAGGAPRSLAVRAIEGPGTVEVPLPLAVAAPADGSRAAARARLLSAEAAPPDAVLDRLEACGLVVSPRLLARQRWWGSLWFFGLGLFGCARVVHGVKAGAPVLYLLGLLVATGGAWWWARRRRASLTVHGERHLRELRAAHPLGIAEPVLGFALYGWVALEGFPVLEGQVLSAGYSPRIGSATAGAATGCTAAWSCFGEVGGSSCSNGGDSGGSGCSGGGDSGGSSCSGGGCGGCSSD